MTNRLTGAGSALCGEFRQNRWTVAAVAGLIAAVKLAPPRVQRGTEQESSHPICYI
jgi:hypothetical protein